jgi:hypothetical protein
MPSMKDALRVPKTVGMNEPNWSTVNRIDRDDRVAIHLGSQGSIVWAERATHSAPVVAHAQELS